MKDTFGTKIFALLSFGAVFFFGACSTTEEAVSQTSEPVQETRQEQQPVSEPPAPAAVEEPAPVSAEPEYHDDHEVVVTVDSVEITKKEFRQTKSEIETVVEDLNKITENENYNAWLTYLDPEYRRTLSNRAYLDRVTRNLPRALQERNVKLSSLRDYFDYVFVPSRRNVRVDDIQFITPTRVYVLMDISRGQRAAVYILEKKENGDWKLVDKN